MELTAEAARNWKKFVADYVVFITKKKANRDCVGGYQVKAAVGGYKVLFGGKDAGYGILSAENLYSWMERLPLVYFSREADSLRAELLKNG